MRQFPSMAEVEQYQQIYDVKGKTVEKLAFLNHTQILVVFTDGTYLCVTSRISGGQPYIGTRINAGVIEKEWK